MKSLAALCGLFLALVLPFATAPSAHAHAVLVASDPVDGSILSAAPPRVSLTFDEPVRMVSGALQVISSNGTRVDLGAQLAPGNTVVEFAMPAYLPHDGYTAMWRLMSADGHEISGSVSFGVGQSPTAPPPTTVERSVTVGADIARGARYAGLVLSVGVLTACGLVWRWALALRRTKILAVVGWLLLIASTVLDYACTGADTVLRVQLGLVVLLAIAGVILMRGKPFGTAVFAVTAVALAAGVAAGGHATGSVPAVVATTAHLLAMAVWLGGLIALALITLRTSEGLERWSRIAFGCITIVILTGEYQAWRQISPAEALWHTSYGITLCVKLFVVVLILGLAYFGRRRLSQDRLRRTVPVEAALGIVVLIASTVLTGEPPARTAFGPPLDVTAPLTAGRSAQVNLATTRHGAIPIGVTAPGATAVSGVLSSSEIAALPVHFAAAADGRWHSTYATAPRPGLWTLQLTVQFGPRDADVTAVPFRAW